MIGMPGSWLPSGASHFRDPGLVDAAHRPEGPLLSRRGRPIGPNDRCWLSFSRDLSEGVALTSCQAIAFIPLFSHELTESCRDSKKQRPRKALRAFRGLSPALSLLKAVPFCSLPTPRRFWRRTGVGHSTFRDIQVGCSVRS